ncbi:MAG: hypothetical protein RL664_699 [Bacteroidota bacterium]|jgi:hypothetical protein
MEFLKKCVLIFCLNVLAIGAFSQSYQIAVLKYKGGGDYYANPTSLPNLVSFVNRELKMNIAKETPYVEVGSTELFNYPFVHMTGHGNVVFSAADAENLRVYLMSGGFLHISDNYGLDKFIRKEMKKVFPDADFVEIPFGHPVYHQKYEFSSGLPKIHEHDNKAPQGLGIFVENRLVVFYDFECDLGDGWEDSNVHKDSEVARTKAFQMGANLLQYAFTGGK